MHAMQIKALSASAGIYPAPMKTRNATAGIPCAAPRSAFTLVELLVVIVILAMLASLVTVAASRAMTSARNAAIKAEIDMLHMAIMNYKNEYGSVPPCSDRVDTDSNNANGYVAINRVQTHLGKLFPRVHSMPTEFASLNSIQAPQLFSGASPQLFSENAIFFWLQGYADSPTAPISGGVRRKLYDFDLGRVEALRTPCAQYHPSGKLLSPYLYRDSSAYFLQRTPSVINAPLVEFDIRTSEDRNRNGILDSGEDTNSNGRIDPLGEDINGNGTLDAGEDVNDDGRLNFGNPFNAETFQIICAGRDEVMGNDDDLSNFWPGTRKDYLDSLNQ